MFFADFNFHFVSTSEEISWEKHLQYKLFSVEWDVNFNSDQFCWCLISHAVLCCTKPVIFML